MSITYPLSLPAANISSIRIICRHVVAKNTSPFTLQEQVYIHPGARFEAEVTIPPMNREEREAWIGWLLQLRGGYGTFLMGDPDATAPQGVATGTPKVKGASQTGNELVTTGWTPSTTDILKAGDYIQLSSGASSRLHKVMDDADSDGSGDATLKLFPPLRESPADSAPIVVDDCKGVFRLASNAVEWETDHCGISSPLTFACVEVI